jgi:2-methylcitrate dehydratase PrpD
VVVKTGPTMELARFAAHLKYEDIPPEVLGKEKAHLLDGLGNGLYGSRAELGQRLIEFAREFRGPAEAALWGGGFRTSCLYAALVNGSLANVTEMEDAHHRTKFKPNTLIVPAGLALGERLGAAGRELLTALVVGNEVGIRLGEATHAGREAYARGWIGTSVIGGFAAAAAAGRLLGLDDDRMAHALSLGGAQPIGLWAGGLAMSKRVMIGRAAESGILAALLAAKGVTGGTQILEAEWGSLPAVVSPAWEPELVTRGLGSSWKTLEIGLECYPTKGALHSALDALLAIVTREGLRGDEIDRIRVRTTTGIVNNRALYVFPPRDFWEAQHSFQYALAVAAWDGACGLEQFAETKLCDPRILDLGRRISLEVDAEADRLSPKTKTAFVEVTTRGGRTYVDRVDYCRGEPENFLTKPQIEAKFRRVARAALDEPGMARVVDLVDGLEDLADVRALTGLLLGAQA